MSFSTCCRAAGTALSLGRSLSQTLLRSKYSTASQLRAGRDSISARLANLKGLRCRVSLRLLSFLVWPGVFKQECQPGLRLHDLVLAFFVLYTIPTYTYFYHRRSNLLASKPASTTEAPGSLSFNTRGRTQRERRLRDTRHRSPSTFFNRAETESRPAQS